MRWCARICGKQGLEIHQVANAFRTDACMRAGRQNAANSLCMTCAVDTACHPVCRYAPALLDTFLNGDMGMHGRRLTRSVCRLIWLMQAGV
jgi:hypothetical protein